MKEVQSKPGLFEANVQQQMLEFKSSQEALQNHHESDMQLMQDRHSKEVVALQQAARIAQQEPAQRHLETVQKHAETIETLKKQTEH